MRYSYGLSSDADMEAFDVILDWFEDEERFRGLLDDLGVGDELISGVRHFMLPMTLQEVPI